MLEALLLGMLRVLDTGAAQLGGRPHSDRLLWLCLAWVPWQVAAGQLGAQPCPRSCPNHTPHGSMLAGRWTWPQAHHQGLEAVVAVHLQRLPHHPRHAVQQPQGGGVPTHMDLICLDPQQGPGPGEAALLVPDQLHHRPDLSSEAKLGWPCMITFIAGQTLALPSRQGEQDFWCWAWMRPAALPSMVTVHLLYGSDTSEHAERGCCAINAVRPEPLCGVIRLPAPPGYLLGAKAQQGD